MRHSSLDRAASASCNAAFFVLGMRRLRFVDCGRLQRAGTSCAAWRLPRVHLVQEDLMPSERLTHHRHIREVVGDTNHHLAH
jgi:hypothetical protein